MSRLPVPLRMVLRKGWFMVDPVPLAPEELDRIEDALEWLETIETIDDPSPRVRDELAAYREILVASRDAMPLEEVPAGLLDDVIAQAHASSGSPTPVAAPGSGPQAGGFWARFRRSFLIPALALAGTSALVLWIARPDPDALGVDRAEVASREPGPSAAKAADGAGAPAQDARAPAGAAAPEPARSQTVDAQSAPATPSATPAPDPAAGLQRLDDAPVEEQKPAAEIGDLGKQADLPGKDKAPGGWDLIEKADSARKAGDCRSARDGYLFAAEDDDPAVRARAFAGLGLCDQAAGNSDAAEENFAKARDEDPAIDAVIDREKAKPYRSSTKASKSSSKKKPKARAPVQKNDPFSGL